MTARRDEPLPLLNGGAETLGEEASARLLSRLPELRSQVGDDSIAQERVWRALARSARRPQRTWQPIAFAGAALAIVLAVVVGMRPRQPAPATLELTAGHVLLAGPTPDWIASQAGTTLSAGSRIHTEAGSRAVITLARSAVIAEPSSDIALEALGPATQLRLTAGTLVAEVNPRRAGESFVVLTTNYRVTVKGTIFSVRERGADDVNVSVSRGLVEVSGAGGSWRVGAGQSWASREPTVLHVDSITGHQRELLDGILRPGPRPTLAVESAPAAQVAAPSLAIAATEAKAPPNESLKGDTSPPERAAREAHTPTAPAPQMLARLDSATAQAIAPPAPASSPSISPAAAPAPASPPSKPFQEALELIRSQRYPEAERALEDLSSGTGPSADLALYELADVRRHHLQDPAGALAALRRYRATFPHGSLLQEAEISMIELQLARPDPSAALPEMDQFLAAHPKSERASEVHWLRGNLLRTRGEFAGALESYRHVEGGSHDEDALYYAAFCEERLGQTDAAAKSLRAYLQRFPSGAHATAATSALGAH